MISIMEFAKAPLAVSARMLSSSAENDCRRLVFTSQDANERCLAHAIIGGIAFIDFICGNGQNRRDITAKRHFDQGLHVLLGANSKEWVDGKNPARFLPFATSYIDDCHLALIDQTKSDESVDVNRYIMTKVVLGLYAAVLFMHGRYELAKNMFQLSGMAENNHINKSFNWMDYGKQADTAIPQKAIGLPCNLASSQTNQERIAAVGGIDPLILLFTGSVNIVWWNGSVGKPTSSLCFTMDALVQIITNNIRYSNRFRECQGIDALINVLSSAWCLSEHLLIKILTLLYTVIRNNDSNCEAFVDKGGVSVLTRVFVNPEYSKYNYKTRILQVMRALTIGLPEIRNNIRSSLIILSILKMASSKRKKEIKQVEHFLSAISSNNNEDCFLIYEDKGINLLITLAQEEGNKPRQDPNKDINSSIPKAMCPVLSQKIIKLNELLFFSLTVVNFSHCGIENGTISNHFTHFIRSLKNLKKLNLSNNKLTYTGMHRICNGVQHHKNLKIIDLSENRIDCAAKLLGEHNTTLSKLPSLKEVIINSNYLFKDCDELFKPCGKKSNPSYCYGLFLSLPKPSFSLLADYYISVNNWIIGLACKKGHQHSEIILEGMRPSGQKFLERHHITKAKNCSARVSTEHLNMKFFDRREYHLSVKKISRAKGETLRRNVDADSKKAGGVAYLKLFPRLADRHNCLTWCEKHLALIDITLDGSTIFPSTAAQSGFS